MEPWKIQAMLAALFAGLTAILAKSGLHHLSPDLGLAVRTVVVFILVTLNAVLWTGPRPLAPLREVPARDLLLLALSGLTAALSWIFYYRAMKTGTVAFVSLVDKGSILVTLLLSWLVLHEEFTRQTWIGAGLILAGIVVLSWK